MSYIDSLLSSSQAEVEALRAEVERLRVGHDRYEFLRRCSLRQLTQIWEAALKSDAQFDAIVDKFRLPDPTEESPPDECKHRWVLDAEEREVCEDCGEEWPGHD